MYYRQQQPAAMTATGATPTGAMPGGMTPGGMTASGMTAGGMMPMQPLYPMQAQTPPPLASGATIPGIPGAAGAPVFEESYIENILRLNLGKRVTVYMTFENNKEWNAKIFKGRLEAAGRDHIIVSDPATGIRYLLLMINLDYVTFDEPLNYAYPGHP